ncbi:hypothetical protein ALC62_14310, partial [Cyphomyrmex costatus]
FYYRYVDDIVLCLPTSKIDELTKKFNSLHDRLQFTCEIGGDRINFLDTTIIISNNSLIFDWYQKPTFSGRFLNFMSQHPVSQKIGIIYGLVDRTFHLSHPNFQEKNLKFIVKILLENDYPKDFIFQNINARIKKLINKQNLEIETTSNNLHINSKSTTHSVITDHRLQFGHDFDWDNCEILDVERFYNKRLTAEMIYINRQEKGLNLQTDTDTLSRTYTDILKKI